jgi:hypothetical protein
MQDATGHDHREGGPNRQGKRAQTDRRHRKCGHQPRRTHRVDQRAARHLTGERDQPTRGQDQTDIKLRPSLCGEIDRDEWTEAGLDIREKKVEPVEAARARRRCGSGYRDRRLLARRRWEKTAIDATIEPTAVKFQR